MNNFTYFYTLPLLHTACATHLLAEKKILDVGCGVGTLSLWLARHGASVLGIDVSKRAIKIAQHAQKKLQFDKVSFRIGQLSQGSGEFDGAICSEVIEHVPNPDLTLDQIHSHLKPGGWLVLTTPTRENLLYKLGYYVQFDKRVGHLRRYTQSEISLLLRQHNFKIIFVREVEGPLRNLLFTQPYLGWMIRFIRGPLVPIFHWFDAWSAKIAGAADIQIVALKPKQVAMKPSKKR